MTLVALNTLVSGYGQDTMYDSEFCKCTTRNAAVFIDSHFLFDIIAFITTALAQVDTRYALFRVRFSLATALLNSAQGGVGARFYASL